MTEQNYEGTSQAAALDIAVGKAVGGAIADDGIEEPTDPATLPPQCLNCGASVFGRYCVDCGQTTDTHVPTLGEVLGDALASIANLDSRIWRTLGALFFRPGRLTLEFLAGKRARYVPPLRLYLVLSVLVFLIISIDPSNDDEGYDLPGYSIEADEEYDCDAMNVPFERGSLIDDAVREACFEGLADDFASMKNSFADNIPLMAFLVIPAMAAVFKLFYVSTGNNYLAHLVFLCHTHAFTFMLFVVLSLLRILAWAAPVLATGTSLLGGALFVVYLPVYYFLAMRRVYRQGAVLTLVKQVVLMIGYLVITMLVFVVGLLVVMLVS